MPILLLFISNLAISQTARIQVIHNSAAKDAGNVDVWIKGSEAALLSDFKFRTASPFVDAAPAGIDLTIQIKAPNSKKEDEALFEKTVKLESGKKIYQ